MVYFVIHTIGAFDEGDTPSIEYGVYSTREKAAAAASKCCGTIYEMELDAELKSDFELKQV